MTDTKILQIHEPVLRLLADHGLSQITPSLRARARAAVAWVDGDGRLRFARALVEDVIARTRRKFTLHGIDLAHDIEIGRRRVHTGTGGAAPTIMDFETGRYRESIVTDLYDIARLLDRLASIHWHHHSIVARNAKRILDLDTNTTYGCLSGTTKSIAVSYYQQCLVRAAQSMLDAVAGAVIASAHTAPPCAAMWCRRCALPPKAAMPWRPPIWPD